MGVVRALMRLCGTKNDFHWEYGGPAIRLDRYPDSVWADGQKSHKIFYVFLTTHREVVLKLFIRSLLDNHSRRTFLWSGELWYTHKWSEPSWIRINDLNLMVSNTRLFLIFLEGFCSSGWAIGSYTRSGTGRGSLTLMSYAWFRKSGSVRRFRHT